MSTDKARIAVIGVCRYCGHATPMASRSNCLQCGAGGWARPSEVLDPLFALCDSMNKVRRLHQQIEAFKRTLREAVEMLPSELPEG